MIEAIDLTVRRRGRAVLDAVSFDVRPGQVTGVLGGMGAGKTTLLRRMVQLDRGGGEALFDGRPYRALAHPMREVGLVLDDAVGCPDHTVRGHLRLVLATDRRAAVEPGARGWLRRAEQGGGDYGQSAEGVLAVRDAEGHRIAIRSSAAASDGTRSPTPAPKSRGNARRGRTRPAHRIDAVLDIVGLSGQSRTRIADLTNGMATRLAIAAALLGDPRTLLLDCPDRGLEPEGVAWLGDLLRAFTSQGRAALVTCADTETAAQLSDRILLLDAGRLVGTRTSEEVLRAPAGAAVIVRSPQIVRFAALLAEAGARSCQGEGASLEVRGLDRARIGDLAYRHGVPLHELAERFTGTDPGDVVLAACSGRGNARAVVPLQSVTRPAVGVGASARRIVNVSTGAAARAQLGIGSGVGVQTDGEAVTGAEGVDLSAVLARDIDEVRAESGGHVAVLAEPTLRSDAGADAAGAATGPGAERAGAGVADAGSAGMADAEFANADTHVPRPGAGAVALDAVALGAGASGEELERGTADASIQRRDTADSVVAAVTAKRIVAGATPESVVAAATAESVVPGATAEPVVTGASAKRNVAGATAEPVIAVADADVAAASESDADA